ncbi:thiamine diphosphokinase [Metabacillus malikii]|uniref:Thiamine diphosphokinase n=1 Tax=Metabacillus malikii TaxID=1504265 RepID=A0ABT9ZEA0_9BACI|nr:thiamine diphosphokinase [Metabacillus malikii]MDQ0230578.1 thiamine pyrophosphokinase [Metabacillus malikii]
MRNIALVAGGPKELIPPLNEYNQDDVTWVGIDRGAVYLMEDGIPISYAFGDFDSITSSEMDSISKTKQRLKIFPPEKDQTDTELALEWAIEQNPTSIRIFGATGGRIDHMLANIQLLMKGLSKRTEIEIIDCQNQLTLHTPGTYTIKEHKEWKYISFIPVSYEVRGITLENFKYPLSNCHIKIGSTLCISNELIYEQGTFSFYEGILLMVRSRD